MAENRVIVGPTSRPGEIETALWAACPTLTWSARCITGFEFKLDLFCMVIAFNLWIRFGFTAI